MRTCEAIRYELVDVWAEDVFAEIDDAHRRHNHCARVECVPVDHSVFEYLANRYGSAGVAKHFPVYRVEEGCIMQEVVEVDDLVIFVECGTDFG